MELRGLEKRGPNHVSGGGGVLVGSGGIVPEKLSDYRTSMREKHEL